MRRRIGSPALDVNAIGFGAWQLSNENRPGDEAAEAVVRAALDGGANLIDTADAYCENTADFGHNESLLARIVDRLGVRDRVSIATKVGYTRPEGRWVPDGRPAWIATGCDHSLARLGKDSLALYQLHIVDPEVPIEESAGALADLQRAGKIERIGLSNVSLDELEQAAREAPIASVQNECNPWVREDVDSGLVDECRARGIAYIPWYPLGGSAGHRACANHPTLRALATKYEVSPYQLLLAWLLGLGEHMLPIPGASRPTSISDSLGATDIVLESADHDAIGALASAT